MSRIDPVRSASGFQIASTAIPIATSPGSTSPSMCRNPPWLAPSSLITAGILYLFGSSVIQGFALVLIIGVLASMFTAITVTRTILRTIVRRQSTRRAWLYGVNDDEFEARPFGRPVRGEARGRV